MKTKLSSLAVMLTALGSLVLSPLPSSAAATQSGMMYRVNAVMRNGAEIVQPGDSVNAVRFALGSPEQRITRNVWVYFNFKVSPTQDRDQDCDRLVVTFEDGRVADLRLVNPRACKVIAARAETDPHNVQRMFASAPEPSAELASLGVP